MDQSQGSTPSKRRRLSHEAGASASLRTLIPPRDCRQLRRLRPSLLGDDDPSHDTAAPGDTDAPPEEEDGRGDWSDVIDRAGSHPHEAQEPYFGTSDNTAGTTDGTILAYQPLHAMLKYDPPLEAVEAVLRAHPAAAVGRTFEGSALQIASASGVTNALVLRLLLVAEMAVRKRMDEQAQSGAGRKAPPETPKGTGEEGKQESGEQSESPSKQVRLADPPPPDAEADASDENEMFVGHNPIAWIADPSIPAQTAAILLKWYPVGAFQRPCVDDGSNNALEESEADSPLIEIVDGFVGDGSDEEEDDDSPGSEQKDHSPSAAVASAREAALPEVQPRLGSARKEMRWEKFLHVLYATDSALEAMRQPASSSERDVSSLEAMRQPASSSERDVSSADFGSSDGKESAAATAQLKSDSSLERGTQSETQLTNPFRPVHAWVRCLTSSLLGLERCRPYAAWSVLREMGKRIPSEFTGRDANDGNRTAFQILAESPASECRLFKEEVRDVVECLIDSDHRSAFLPRNSDGRLIGHVALENGWPCKDLFSRKKSATCA